MKKRMLIRAVVVDDDKNVCDVFSELLRIKGINVVGIGHDGKDAVELYKKHKPEVIILEMLLPKYDGSYAIDKIKSEFPKACVIVITKTIKEYQLAKEKVKDVFLKPCKIHEVLKAIEDCAKISLNTKS